MSRVLLRTPYVEDIPLAFVYNSSLTHQAIFCGAYIQTILQFATYKRYDLEIQFHDELKKNDINAKIRESQFNISLLGTTMHPYDNSILYSYPVELLRSCIMVPLPPELPKFMYVVWPLGRYIWTTLFLGIFYVAALKSCLELRRRNFRQLLQRNMLQSIGILSFTANMNISFVNIPLREKIFYFLLLVLGFVLSSYHSAHLVAYCMKPIFVQPISTVKELLAARLKVIITNNFYEELIARQSMDLSFLETVLERRSQRDYQTLLKKLNRSVAYVVTQHQWNYLNKQQRLLIQPYFRLTNICFESLLNAFPLNLNATFADSLNMWLLQVKESGLWRYWDEQAFQAAISAKYAKYLWDTYPVEPLNLAFFRIGWIVLAVGLPLSCLGFILEWYTHKRKTWSRYRHWT